MLNAPIPNRDQLFREVWTTPMVHVGSKYGISGTDVRRVCDAFRIPVPLPGHWTRVDLGHTIQRPQLPAMSEQEVLAAISAVKAIIDRPKRLVEVRADKRIQKDNEVAADAAPKQKDWHRAIKQLREQMDKGVTRAEHLKKRYEWEQSHPGKQYQHKGEVVYGNWESFCDTGQLLVTSHRKLAARLSVDTYQRGLLILNIICHGAELEGYTVQMAKDNERLELSKGGAHVEVRITEKLTQGTRYRINTGKPFTGSHASADDALCGRPAGVPAHAASARQQHDCAPERHFASLRDWTRRTGLCGAHSSGSVWPVLGALPGDCGSILADDIRAVDWLAQT